MHEVIDRMQRWFRTPAGKRFLDDAERDGAERETAIARRRELRAQIEEAKRAQREDLPKLHAASERADAVPRRRGVS